MESFESLHLEEQKVPETTNFQSKEFHKKITSKIDQDERTQWQKKFHWDDLVDLCNREVFKNQSFRENQREIINCTKSGKDALALIPTGGGKSLTFQLAAITDEGVTIVVMPLLSLIEDNLTFVQ